MPTRRFTPAFEPFGPRRPPSGGLAAAAALTAPPTFPGVVDALKDIVTTIYDNTPNAISSAP